MANAPTTQAGTAEARAVPPPEERSQGLPELLAPAGDWDCVKAAVENGADAVYFGLEKFNARMRANNFTEADLPELMAFLHKRGVKGYVTFNTLVFANELADAEQYLRTIIAAGVDAAIVQDIGICRMIRKISPDFPIHASTQMTITSAAGVEFARELGCNLVVLARECSLKEIERIQDESRKSRDESQPAAGAFSSNPSSPGPRFSPLPLEIFVHGALCVAYSGQCLTSEALGGRSANRGECAQACRMPYELISDGKPVPLGDRRYLLSPQDLAGLELLPRIADAGVASLKIEGRLKSPEYVASITRVYRKALDELPEGPGSSPRPSSFAPRPTQYELEMSFSRGLYTGWFGGVNNQQLVHARFGKKRGVYLGEVKRLLRDAVVLELSGPIKPGDGVVFDAGQPDQKEEGGRVYEVRNSNSETRNQFTGLRFGHGDIDFSRVHVGDKVWKTSDPALDRELRQTFTGSQPRFQRPVQFEVHGRPGAPMTVLCRDDAGHAVKAVSTMPLTEAEQRPLTDEKLREQLGRLGGTAFRLAKLVNHLEANSILPVSELNRLRREVVDQLEEIRARPRRWTMNEQSSEPQRDIPPPHVGGHGEAELIVLVRNLKQLEAALRCDISTIYCEFEDPKKYREAVRLGRETRGAGRGLESGSSATLFVAPPRITKPGEEWILNQVRSCDADGYLIRNYDHLECFRGCRRVGDFSLNVANPLTAEYFMNRYGLERLTASYDLNIAQLEALLRSAPPEWFEITLHQHMPMFHMEHCVFCAFLSEGTDYTNCGRPCDRHDARLRDRVGIEHPLKADAGCRNTVFNGRAQTGAEFAGRLMELGARRFRIEFVNEQADEIVRTISMYRQLLRGEISGERVWRELKLFNQLGVTRGQMEGG